MNVKQVELMFIYALEVRVSSYHFILANLKYDIRYLDNAIFYFCKLKRKKFLHFEI